MYRNITRIRATEDIRILTVNNNAFGGDPTKLQRSLKNDQGNICEYEVKNGFDKDGFNRLKRLTGGS
jgi:hypothetical protein